jgi:hypothetical protein
MRFEGFTATPDLIGRRIRLSWSYALDPLETPLSLPEVLLRRKDRDFAFPPLVPGDPYLIYDSVAFPPVPVPAVQQVIDLPGEERIEAGLRAISEVISVASITAGVPQEVLRRTRTVYYDTLAQPVRVRDEVLDARALEPGRAQFYEIDDGSAPPPESIADFRAVVTPGEIHGLNRKLWEMLPEVYRRQDTTRPAASAIWPGVPEAGPSGGQLRRFTDMFGMGVDLLRNSAEGLRSLRDIQEVEPRFLPHLGRMIGWEVPPQLPVEQSRNDLANATRLFDVVGTVQAMRAMVGHQTGWRSQVGEFAQNIARAGVPPRRSVYLRREVAGDWIGGLDMAAAFGFPPGGSTGSGALPALMTGATLEPFALAPGGELTLTVDGGAPVRVRFGPEDFGWIEAATAAEVASVINAAFDDVVARDVAGAVEIETVLTGPAASVRAETARQSLLALSDAPSGPAMPVAGVEGVLRLFYLQRNDPGQAEAVTFTARSAAPASGNPARTDRDIRMKSWGFGEWREEQGLPDWSRDASGVAATALPGGALGVAWIGDGRLHFASGLPRASEPARLTSLRAEPFQLVAGGQITFRLRSTVEVFTVNAADYALPAAATALEVAAAMNAQFVGLSATALPDGTVQIATVATGDPARLSVDLSASTVARRLGFAARDLGGRGRWDHVIDWGSPLSGPQVWNPVADPALVSEPAGGVRLGWAENLDERWQIRLAHRADRVVVATPLGAAVRSAGGGWTVWTTVDGLGSDDVRGLGTDADGTLWFATAAGLSRRRSDGTWATLTTLDGLASDDLRGLAILPSGSVAAASGAGLSEVDTTGAVTVTNASPLGLPSDDIRALVTDGTGALWLATAAGLGRRDRFGGWRRWTVAEGLPPAMPRALAVAPGGRAALATAAGVALWDGTSWSRAGLGTGLPSDNARDLAFGANGTLWVATDAGLGRLREGRWRVITSADGLPSNDLNSVAVASDGRILLGTPAGLARGLPDDGLAWQVEGVPQGLPSPVIRAAHAAWSAPRILTPGTEVEREPHLAREAGGDLWLLVARRATAAADLRDDWTLVLRRHDPGTFAWGPDQAVTAALPAGSVDRTPFAEAQAGGGFRVFFGTDRTGGAGIGHVDVSAAGVVGAPVILSADPDEATHPTAIAGPDGSTWLFTRADSPVIQAQTAILPPPGQPGRVSGRVPEASAASHRSGARTPVMAHAARHALRRRFADPGVYTPEYPDRIDADLPGSLHIYTRRTLGLYLRQSPWGKPITQVETLRLLQLLNRNLPINLRIRLIIAPDPLVEFVYAPGADIEERWSDTVPFVDTLTGLADSTAVAVPGLAVLISNDVANRSAEFLDPATLLRRTWFPDLL